MKKMSEEGKVGFVTMGEAKAKPVEVRELGVGMLGYAFMGRTHSNATIQKRSVRT